MDRPIVGIPAQTVPNPIVAFAQAESGGEDRRMTAAASDDDIGSPRAAGHRATSTPTPRGRLSGLPRRSVPAPDGHDAG
jgi:hypothetical protein